MKANMDAARTWRSRQWSSLNVRKADPDRLGLAARCPAQAACCDAFNFPVSGCDADDSVVAGKAGYTTRATCIALEQERRGESRSRETLKWKLQIE